ncbi:hypothetical protein C0995_013216 [Termitomyces sp. Mi166|nr:hypothetical protein C0995_013216 [Termitomyces sp. Mi166\
MTSPRILPKLYKDNSINIEVEENKRASNVDALGLPEPGTPERLEAERKLVRKLDWRLLPTIAVIYIMNYIDRNGITTARLKGMEQDLGLSAQIPSNMVTKNFGGILACRVFIGLPEAAFYPGALYLLSRWYTKKELPFKVSILYAGQLLSNAFGAVGRLMSLRRYELTDTLVSKFMAAGILENMEGKRGIRAWRWWLLPDYVRLSLLIVFKFSIRSYQPHNTVWMTSQESRLALARISEDAGEADQDTTNGSPLKGLKMAISDPLVLIFTLQAVSQILSLSFMNFFPTLTQTLGFSTTISLLLAAYESTAALYSNYSLTILGRRMTGERFFHIAVWWWGAMIGFIIGLSTMEIPGRYIAMFLMASGKRAAAMGIVNGVGNLGSLSVRGYQATFSQHL